jgi:lipopolysaccharide transport system ATP-binding protein
MSDDVVIRAERLGKKYSIGHEAERERYVALRDVIARSAQNLWRKTADVARGRAIVVGDTIEDFWALRDVSFEVKRGEVLGIIGRNGAGKSTLLKILSRITEPSAGRVTIKGRVASLLEVGTGFHPELTGRENIYLNGAILGMTHAEIRRKFDEIVAFADVEKFLDTPVKRYSSGMYVRLAFAVAAHLEPEILVIDEVLAVGDAEFQRKCLGRMSEVASGGRTVLFVSHNIAAVQRICGIGLFLSSGRVEKVGGVAECIDRYLSNMPANWRNNQLFFPQKSLKKPHITCLEILDDKDQPLPYPHTKDYVRFRIHFYSPYYLKNGSVELFISMQGGPLLTRCSTSPDSTFPVEFKPGHNVVDCDFQNLMLSAGTFTIGAGLAIPNVEWFDEQPDAATLTVEARDILNSGMAPVATRYPVPMDHIWRVPKIAGLGNAQLESLPPAPVDAS